MDNIWTGSRCGRNPSIFLMNIGDSLTYRSCPFNISKQSIIENSVIESTSNVNNRCQIECITRDRSQIVLRMISVWKYLNTREDGGKVYNLFRVISQYDLHVSVDL